MVTDPADRWPMSRVRDYLRAGPPAREEPSTTTLAFATTDAVDDTDTDTDTDTDAGPGTRHEVAVPQDGLAASVAASGPAGHGRPGAWLGARLAAAPARLHALGRTAGQHGLVETDGVSLAHALADAVGVRLGTVIDPIDRIAVGANQLRDRGAADRRRRCGGHAHPCTQYVETALADPPAAWDQLSPRFQEDCCEGDEGNYTGYWNTIATATLRDITADPQQMTVTLHHHVGPGGRARPRGRGRDAGPGRR